MSANDVLVERLRAFLVIRSDESGTITQSRNPDGSGFRLRRSGLAVLNHLLGKGE